ncbi:uncharacterized protein [Hyperolius riggenbachi]|uniref:uncharacterized protein isoform X1 n=2 Tax=Hyperolius riggenbachi TaxID=752182 RepID=UPI0035A2C3E6
MRMNSIIMAHPTNNPLNNGQQSTSSTREELLIALQNQMRAMSGQDRPSESFPSNPIRDPNNPNHFDDVDRDRIGHVQWCSCQKCVPMPTGLESVCCKEISNLEEQMEDINCITEHADFYNFCQNPNYARVFLFVANGSNGLNRSQKDANRSYRKASYRAFTGFAHGFLGRGNRRPIPACVVKKVREAFPDPDGQYMGYKACQDIAAEYMV